MHQTLTSLAAFTRKSRCTKEIATADLPFGHSGSIASQIFDWISFRVTDVSCARKKLSENAKTDWPWSVIHSIEPPHIFANFLFSLTPIFNFPNCYFTAFLCDHCRSKLKPPRLNQKTPIRCKHCLLYTSPSPRDQRGSRMPSSA